jgi:hypothetical protein
MVLNKDLLPEEYYWIQNKTNKALFIAEFSSGNWGYDEDYNPIKYHLDENFEILEHINKPIQ